MSGRIFQLKDNHTWKAAPGNSICVLDRGLVRFEYPSSWTVEAKDGALYLHDSASAVERCDLGVSLFQVPGIDFRQLDLEDTLRAVSATEWKSYFESGIHSMKEPDFDAAWLEQHYVDAEHNRDARFRIALARGRVLCLISFNYWTDRAAVLEPVWDELFRSLAFGVQIADPTAGPLVQ